MKKTFIIIGTILILTLIVVWVYLLMYGTPKNTSEIFANFGLSGEETPHNVVPQSPEQPLFEDNDSRTPPEDVRLWRVADRPVAGAVFVDDNIQYVEQGTGHVYQVDTLTGTETLLSGTTIPQTSSATFFSGGDSVAITSFTTTGTETIVGDIRDGELRGVALPHNATEIEFTDDGTIYYLLKNEFGATAYQHDLDTQESDIEFSIPLRDVRVLWGEPHYIYTTPSALQRGYLYEVGAQNTLSYVTRGGDGLVAVRYDNGVITTLKNEDVFEFVAISEEDSVLPQAVPHIPEKCGQDPVRSASFFCAVPTNLSEGSFPDDWYMGAVTYTDTLWSINIEDGQALSLADLSREAGEDMDISTIGVSGSGLKLFLINKHNNTLWVFDRTVE